MRQVYYLTIYEYLIQVDLNIDRSIHMKMTLVLWP